ncbi:hypothetical protein [Halorussus sp. MSC15.2]|uniref:hypothetical protein n=1 Tax=Halorussus sp. MSC15.2 TaxID=2283638 RepID=UPI0013D1E144|nr:hypothetical protein [Halorussus sp. MSC15.2]NEU58891.1 hypothetical protein [Halorussus sp. MSC15.2]
MEIKQVVLQVGVLLIACLSFRVYFDGLERVSNLEANLWAVAVLFAGVAASFVGAVEGVAVALFSVLLYAARTRLA